jgi:hypothetical protein
MRRKRRGDERHAGIKRRESNMPSANCLEIQHASGANRDLVPKTSARYWICETTLLDTRLLSLYKNPMQIRPRTIIAAVTQLALAGCSVFASSAPPPVAGTAAPGAVASQPVPNVSPTIETPVPIARVSSGDRALFYGDYELAAQEYSTAVAATDDPAILVAALWGLARTQHSDGRFDASMETLQRLTADFPDSGYAAPARFLEGQNLAALRRRERQRVCAYISSHPRHRSVSGLREAPGTGGVTQALDSHWARTAPHRITPRVRDQKIAQTTHPWAIWTQP